MKPAYEYCISFANDPQVILNEYIKGQEFSTEGLMVDGRFYMTGISERAFHYEKYKPLFVEIGDVMPTLLEASEVQACADLTHKAAIELGITNGIVKGDLIRGEDDGEFRVLELTPRLGGPRFGTEMIPLSNGTNILKAAIQQALGEKIDMELLRPKYHLGMVNRTIFAKPGRLKFISGLEAIKELPGYYDFKWWKAKSPKIGDVISAPQSMSDGPGYVIVTGSDRDEAIANADRIEAMIIFETEEEV
ncbi:ATP-grasp domain-containing protein [Paenibacillus hexagrammi]|uniref:ATP-grasp domain-containing protein n=1 Tax=Paenibacillus hexagrammi TaxID=2908839 RepID=A0ABY3SPZ7_9BACL|nr:hypothetical protein [Paenibacillus sp. YPD9-1]UJF35533.1 hypothetical protein L0M14_10775 [Paenibacillus sp. YPD9-1]